MAGIKRRDFIKGTAASAAAATLPWAITGNVLGANDEIRFATVGFRSRGHSHINGIGGLKGCTLAALCDADKSVVEKGVRDYSKKFKTKVDGYVDMRELYERKDIDVITTATPNHWHSLTTIWAIQSGKDVYCEKPVCHNVWEGRQMVNAARRYGKIVQTGTQSRSSLKGIGEAVKFVQDGKLGKIQYVVGTCFKPRMSIGKLEEPLEIPQEIDYELWCGPAAKVDLYRKKVHYDWHWDHNTGNGDMGNQGIHQMDIARWFTGETKLSPKVMSIGGRYVVNDAGNTPNTQTVIHAYDKAPLIFETRGMPKGKEYHDLKKWRSNMPSYRGSRIGVIVQCEGGHVVVPSYYSSTAYDKDGKKMQSWNGGGNHFANFIDAVRSRKKEDLNADIYEGYISSALCHTGMISHHVGKLASRDEIDATAKQLKAGNESWGRIAEHLEANGVNLSKKETTLGPWLEMDVNTERFTNNDKANKFLSRNYRKGFEVPSIDAVALKG